MKLHISKYLLLSISLFSIWSCVYEQKIKDGTTAYQRKQFSVAIDMLPKDYQQAKTAADKGQAAYMLAESYRRTGAPASAADWYKTAMSHSYGGDVVLKYARMLQQSQQYDEAARAYQSAGRDEGDVQKYREYADACRQAKIWLEEADSNEYKVEILDFNTPATDFSPWMYNENQLLFSSDRDDSEGKEAYKWTGEKFFDFYQVNIADDIVSRFDIPFNAAYHQSNLIFNNDSTVAYFTQCGSDQRKGTDYCTIMQTKKKGAGEWTTPKELDLGGGEYNYMHPCLSPDEKKLFFATNNIAGYGGYDLYVSIWLEAEEEWGLPSNLGSQINTRGNEVFPSLHMDTLYFSSDGHPGMGGLDVFSIEKVYDRWENLENLKAPINSGSDDFGFIVNKYAPYPDTTLNILAEGYWVSNRFGGQGSDDIYKFIREFPKPEPPIEIDTPPVPELVLVLRLDGIVKEKVHEEEGTPNSPVIGTSPLTGASVQVISEDTIFTMSAELDGTFTMAIDTGVDYTFKGLKPGYFNDIQTLTTKGIVLTEEEPEKVLTIELVLDRIYTNQEIVLENIYYDFDKDNIRDDAKPTLDSLTQILVDNPNINIQLSSHTDCKGSDSYNLDLSQRRAESAVRYLVSNGINEERLQAKGYGETIPAVDCRCSRCTDDELQANRRTTFMILE